MQPSGTATTQAQPNVIQITLDANGNIVLSGGEEQAAAQGKFKSKASRNQLVSWCCDSAFAIVCNEETPFDTNAIAGAKGACNGDKVRGDAAQKSYKYSVVVARGDNAPAVLDPELIIR